jgi:chaperone BCS1
MSKLELLVAFFKTNMVFAGVFGGMAMGSIAWFLKAVPKTLSDLFFVHCTTVVEVTSIETGYYPLLEWLFAKGMGERSRNARVLDNPKKVEDTDPYYIFTPGIGTHFFWNKGNMFWVSHTEATITTATSSWDKPTRTLVLRTIGRKKNRIKLMIDEAFRLYHRLDQISLVTYDSSGRYQVQKVPKRTWDSVFIPQEVKLDIRADVKNFFADKAWYSKVGTPHRRGYLFHGPPGTGKSSLAKAIASEFNKMVCYINLRSMSCDTTLQDVLSKVKDCIVLIEDVDAMDLTNNRTTPTPTTETKDEVVLNATTGVLVSGAEAKKEAPVGVTLSGLLNSIDGIVASEGRILILTTNHPEKLDPAILRPGRIDRSFLIGLMEPEVVGEMFLGYFPDKAEYVNDIVELARTKELSPADWRGVFIEHKSNIEGIFSKNLDEYKEVRTFAA